MIDLLPFLIGYWTDSVWDFRRFNITSNSTICLKQPCETERVRNFNCPLCRVQIAARFRSLEPERVRHAHARDGGFC
ncbi:hypothetical protein Patl1_15187 [Pistacia atlantica]|uniref:Uncharacterized protein n=1 Tax=Pistacia atlantica TaxID=434234 RepID=A0ACC1B5B9_9ROSI|nr:hypothetical protein Patl1_15187 [Pistacia atlantica]